MQAEPLTIRAPDVAFVQRERIPPEGEPEGFWAIAPDLVIEIISESTGRKDRELKLGLYQKARVPEYWLVDPKSQQITVYHLKGGRYESVGSFHDAVGYQAIEGVAVDLSKVW